MRSSGYFTQVLKLGRFTYNIYYTYNPFDYHWYLNINGVANGVRVNADRNLVKINDGYLVANGSVDKYNFNGVDYVS